MIVVTTVRQTAQQQTNRVFRGKDGIIYNLYLGDQTGQTVKNTGDDVNLLLKRLKRQGKKILILADISQIGNISLPARQVGLGLIQELEYDKLAIYGADFMTGSIVKVIVSVSGRSYKIRSFDSKPEAVEWLKS